MFPDSFAGITALSECVQRLVLRWAHRHRRRSADQRNSRRDPATSAGSQALMSDRLPDPRLSRIYRLEATLGQPLDLGETTQGHRRIVPLNGGTFSGPESTVSWFRVPAPTGRSSCPTEPRSPTSATRCGQTEASCSTADHEASATAAPRSSRDSHAARTSTQASTRSAPRPRSRPPHRSSTG